MYELFEFVKLLSVKGTKSSQNHGNVGIRCFAWKEEGEISFLALLCTNDYLLLRYDVTGKPPIIKQVPWLPDKTIASMCFDPTLSWLLIATESSNELYILPALSIVNPNAVVNQLFKTDDVTVCSFKIPSGHVTCVLWWQTLTGQQVAIIGTKVGEILLIDLEKKGEPTKVTIDVSVTDISLSQDDQQINTTLLITTVTGNQWRMLLETRTTISTFFPDLYLNEMGYDNIDGRSIPPRSILDQAEEYSSIFSPCQFTNFKPPTLLKPQYARGRHFITAHSTVTSTLQVLDSDAEHSPLFVYKLPGGARNVILTDKLIFTVLADSREGRLMVLSNQKSENSMDEGQEFSSSAIVQQFILPEGEKLIGVERKRYPFYYHEHHETEWTNRIRAGSGSIILPSTSRDSAHLDASVLNIPVTTHTVLDGCVIVTDSCVYEIRPCISPEHLFLHLALVLPETTPAENLAISVGLDLTSLSELAAEFMLKQSHFGKAMKLFTLSKISWHTIEDKDKCPPTKRTGGLARHGCISETMIHLRSVLSSPGFELNTFERKFLSNMLLHCFVYQLQQQQQPGPSCGGQPASNVHAGLSDFLSGSFSFDEQTALRLLADFSEVDLLLTLAKARGLVVDALSALAGVQAFCDVPHSALSDLVQRGFTAHLVQFGQGCLLPCLPPDDLARLLMIRPQIAIQHSSVLRPLLPELQQDQLLELARIFDPSRSVMRNTLLRLQTSRGRTNSMTSLSSMASDNTDATPEFSSMCVESLLEFFMLVVLYLNRQRRLASTDQDLVKALDFSAIITDPMEQTAKMERSRRTSDQHRKLGVQAQPVACGPKHAAAIRNGDLYTWGRSLQGRLGHGDIPQAVCPPTRVETLHMLKLRVEAVACGCEHTLALTQQGVYGWGNSKYGQVGVGTRHVYRRPMLVEGLQLETVVSVQCGHYHSLALTEDHQVYSWGWGVHGQLGHGNPEDCLIPTHVRYLMNKGVVKVAAGYAHSLALTESGDVWSFGCGYFGQLGLGTNSKTSIPERIIFATTSPMVAIGTNYFHGLAVSATNRVFQWGLHPHNLRQVASSMRMARHAGVHVSEQNSFLSPSIVDTTYVHGKITKLCCGSLHSILVADDGGVYIWGRNLEGQLGTGSRQDERMPKMLASINDQQIVSVASGGEFNVCFDAEGGIWVWGKNDAGQLGYLKTRPSNKMASGQSRRHTQQMQTSDLSTPAPLKAVPPSDTSNAGWLTYLAVVGSEQQWKLTGPDMSYSGSGVLDNLPDLDKLGEDLYSSCVVPVMLKEVESICETSFCLQKSVDLQDWLTAAFICDLEDSSVQALHYRLRFVTESVGKIPMDDIANLCAKLVEHHLSQVMEKNLASADKDKELQHLSSHALYFWEMYNLPAPKLEAIFMEYLSQLSPWLIQIVLSNKECQQPSSDEKLHKDMTEVTKTGLPDGKIAFSSHFSLLVLKSVMDAGPAMAVALTSGVTVGGAGGGRTSADWLAGFSAAPGSVNDDLLRRRVQLQPREKLMPRSRLWADILRNMKKDPGAISLSHSQLEHLEEAGQQTGVLSANHSTTSCRAVVFTCGHHFSDRTFTSEAVNSLITELTSSGPGRHQFPNTAALFKQLFSLDALGSGNEVLMPSACPKCVLRGLLTT
ncbi:X-linked retinitis pigmentosa GTPase regulator-like protein [Plakobranchus ocellatus]|uniref:X-linked retinitis pigmentosa GTPase regulator-like protein n=1 Tax=Plakobranchus ocellatus TaxID=259542 RepID=A0AAV4DR08_9GAST|nr:X-linked retinitis pigmentosa GTPase regulator-like protein [Plakobranchus ocellatus]